MANNGPPEGTWRHSIMMVLAERPARFGSYEMRRMAWDLVNMGLVAYDGKFRLTSEGRKHLETCAK